MAEVHLAHDEHGQAVAIKRLLAPYSANADFKAMFVDEARIGTLLSHPNIARVLELGEHEGQLYLVLEHVEGCDLLQPPFGISQQPGERGSGLPLGIAAHIGSGIAAGLAYAHSLHDERGEPRSIVHRDVSPANVLVGFDGIPRLIDFGIAKARDRLAQTMGDVVKGKFAYMSPEQINGQVVDGRSDIFALGAVIYALLTGREAFRGENQLVTIQRVSLAQAPPPSSLVESLPRDIDDVVARALARDPAQRYQEADELRRDLLRTAAKHGERFGAMAMSAWMYEKFGDEDEQERESISDAQRALSASAHLGPVSQPLPALSTGDVDIGVDQYDSTQLAGQQVSAPPEEPTVLGEVDEHTVLDRDAAARIRSKLGALGPPSSGGAETPAVEREEKTVRRVRPSFAVEQETLDEPAGEPVDEAGTMPEGLSPQATLAQGVRPEMPDEDLWDGDSQTRATLGFEEDSEATFVPSESASADEEDPIELLRREADDELSGRVDWQPSALEAPDASNRTVAHFADATAPTRAEEATVARLADDNSDTAGGQRGPSGLEKPPSGLDDFDDETADLANAALDETAPLPAVDTEPNPRDALPPQAYRDDDPRAHSSPSLAAAAAAAAAVDDDDDDDDLLGDVDEGREQTLTGESLSSLLDDDDDDDDEDERASGEAAAARTLANEHVAATALATDADEQPEPQASSALWIGLIVVLALVGVALAIYLLR